MTEDHSYDLFNDTGSIYVQKSLRRMKTYQNDFYFLFFYWGEGVLIESLINLYNNKLIPTF